MTNRRVIKKMKVSDENDVCIFFVGNSDVVQAKALEIKKDDNGNISYMCLDRLIHKPDESQIGFDDGSVVQTSFQVKGCFATELYRVDVTVVNIDDYAN